MKDSPVHGNLNKMVSEAHSLSDLIHSALGPERPGVGVTFFSDEREYRNCAAETARHALSFCMMVKLAAMGRTLKADESRVSCPGAKRALGLIRPNEDFNSGARYFSLGLYKNMDTARATAETVTLIPPGDVYGFSVQELASCDEPPQVVILVCNPYQAMRIVQGYAYHFGPAPGIRSNGMQGVCSELTARPFVTGDINVSLLCSNTRFSCAWRDAELGVGMPFEMLPIVLDGVIRTVNSAEPKTKKMGIIERSDRDPSRCGVKPGNTYYWRRNAARMP